MTIQSIHQLIRQLERDLLDAKSLLSSGLSIALEHLLRAGEATTSVMTGQVRQRLVALEGLGEVAIDEIERHVRHLNDLATRGAIRTAEDFDRCAKPLSMALQEGRQALANITAISGKELAEGAGKVVFAWRNLHLYIEIVRLELALAEEGFEEEGARVRATLAERCEEAVQLLEDKEYVKDTAGLYARVRVVLEGEPSECLGDLKTLFLFQGQAGGRTV
jgi:hypothetical protein